jgi:four helix bundle protein
MNPINSFRDLDAWRVSMDLNDEVINTVRLMPRIEFDLKRQMRRSALSIPCNIAEGYRRKKRTGAYQNHVSIAMGSQGELDTQMEVCVRNKFLKLEESARLLDLCDRVGALLYRLHDSLD